MQFFLLLVPLDSFLCVNAWKIDNLIKSFLFYIKKKFCTINSAIVGSFAALTLKEIVNVVQSFSVLFCYQSSAGGTEMKGRKKVLKPLKYFLLLFLHFFL